MNSIFVRNYNAVFDHLLSAFSIVISPVKPAKPELNGLRDIFRRPGAHV
jgi:hypothetical protein